VSWIDRVLEERLARAAADGELDAHPALKGKPIGDLHHHREQGWWAKRFVERELSRERRQAALAASAAARAGFWRASSATELCERVRSANAAIAEANLHLVDADRLEPFDVDDVIARSRGLRS
jgi:hypothetical protein